MTLNDEILAPLELEWKTEEFVNKRSGSAYTATESAWVTVSGLENIVRLRPGGRIRAIIGGSPRWGYRVDLIAEVEYGREQPFQTVALDLASMGEAQRQATTAIESLGVVP